MTKFTFQASRAGLVALSLGLLASCGHEQATTDANLLASNDYEELVGWVPGVESVTRERAHSGKYSVVVGPANEFGLGYGMEMSKLMDHKPHKIHLEAWGYMTDTKSSARLGFQLMDQNKEIFGDGIDFASAVATPGKWVKISKDITLPATVSGTNQMRVFLWRSQASTPAYIDDLRISEVPD